MCKRRFLFAVFVVVSVSFFDNNLLAQTDMEQQQQGELNDSTNSSHQNQSQQQVESDLRMGEEVAFRNQAGENLGRNQQVVDRVDIINDAIKNYTITKHRVQSSVKYWGNHLRSQLVPTGRKRDLIVSGAAGAAYLALKMYVGNLQESRELARVQLLREKAKKELDTKVGDFRAYVDKRREAMRKASRNDQEFRLRKESTAEKFKRNRKALVESNKNLDKYWRLYESYTKTDGFFKGIFFEDGIQKVIEGLKKETLNQLPELPNLIKFNTLSNAAYSLLGWDWKIGGLISSLVYTQRRKKALMKAIREPKNVAVPALIAGGATNSWLNGTVLNGAFGLFSAGLIPASYVGKKVNQWLVRQWNKFCNPPNLDLDVFSPQNVPLSRWRRYFLNGGGRFPEEWLLKLRRFCKDKIGPIEPEGPFVNYLGSSMGAVVWIAICFVPVQDGESLAQYFWNSIKKFVNFSRKLIRGTTIVVAEVMDEKNEESLFVKLPKIVARSIGFSEPNSSSAPESSSFPSFFKIILLALMVAGFLFYRADRKRKYKL